jgi:site-specific DNA-methyltransferase (adenine-specific)
MRDVWDISILNSQSKERTGYRTQKPLALLHRIVKASSNEGDVVLDPFCGCATTCVAAQQLRRKWIGIDIEKKAVDILVDRLRDDAGLFTDFINTDIVPQRTDVTIEEPSASIKERLYKEQKGLCNGCNTDFDMRNMEIDHILPKAKGGGDYYENYQLLCGSCNRIKGDRPMEYLRMKVKVREEMIKNKIVFGE